MTGVIFVLQCPQCNHSNMATAIDPKYKEIVYQSCNENDGTKDHDVKNRIKRDSCHINFDFYWCAVHCK